MVSSRADTRLRYNSLQLFKRRCLRIVQNDGQNDGRATRHTICISLYLSTAGAFAFRRASLITPLRCDCQWPRCRWPSDWYPLLFGPSSCEPTTSRSNRLAVCSRTISLSSPSRPSWSATAARSGNSVAIAANTDMHCPPHQNAWLGTHRCVCVGR